MIKGLIRTLILIAIYSSVVVSKASAVALCANNAPGIYIATFDGFGGIAQGLLGTQNTKDLRVEARSYSYSQRAKAFEDILRFLDTNNNGFNDQGDDGNNIVYIVGYSWGAMTTLDLGHQLSSSPKIGPCVALSLVTVDPVKTARNPNAKDYVIPHSGNRNVIVPPERSALSNPRLSLYTINLYQRVGFLPASQFYRKLKLIKWIFRGSSVKQAQFDRDVNQGLTEPQYDHGSIQNYFSQPDFINHVKQQFKVMDQYLGLNEE